MVARERERERQLWELRIWQLWELWSGQFRKFEGVHEDEKRKCERGVWMCASDEHKISGKAR